MTTRARDNIIAVQFALPSLIVICIFILYPVAKSIAMSVTNWYLLSGSPTHGWLGLQNFAKVLTDTDFLPVVIATLVYTFVSVAGMMFVGLTIAVLLNKKFVGRSFLRGLVIIPWAMPSVVACTVFLLSLDPTYGIFNWVLLKIHAVKSPVSFFSRPGISLATVTLIRVWKYFPFTTLMLLAGMQGIPQEYYNAAKIDGAGGWKQFRYITWPLLLPVFMIVLILQILWTVKAFTLVYLTTAGGPADWTSIMGVNIYLKAFSFYQVGQAAAQGMMLLVFSVVMSVFYFVLYKKVGNP